MQKMTKRQIQAINTKNNIYTIAINLMEKKGYDNITIEEICKKAGVSVGTFYHYFKSKYDIFIEIYTKADDYFYNNVANNLKEHNTLDKIIEYFDHYATYNTTCGIDTMKQLYNPNNKMFIKHGRFMQTVLQDIIKKGQEKNEICIDMTPEKVTEYLFIVARGVVYDWCLHDGQYDLNEAMNTFMKHLIVTFKS
ncbi:TetR/AcrR family transcriptional regulator [Clostridiaceae bacterium 35-E11]